MKSATTIITVLLLLGLTACSNDNVKVGNKGESTEKASVEVNKETQEKEEENATIEKVELKEYNFEEFKTISEGEQKEYIQTLMSNLGYTDALGNWILSLINDPESQIPGSINTISEYANFYVTEVEIQDGYKLDWKLEEEKKEAKSGNTEDDIVTIKDPVTSEPFNISKESINKRINAINKEPLFEIEPNGQYSLLGIGTGYSFEYVKNLLGEPDKVGLMEGGNTNIYYIPGETLRDGLEFYKLVILVSEDTITGVRLNMNNKEEFERSMEIPNEFSESFDGELLTSRFTDKSYEYWYDFHMMFIRNMPGSTDVLEIYPDKNDYQINLSIWNDTEWDVFNVHTRSIFRNIPLEEAKNILKGPKAAGM